MRGSKLLKAIIEVVNDLGAEDPHHPKEVTDELLRRKYWGTRVPKTPLRTVTSYFSENPETFVLQAGGGYYYMLPAHHRPRAAGRGR
jgi:hypothetical protein